MPRPKANKHTKILQSLTQKKKSKVNQWSCKRCQSHRNCHRASSATTHSPPTFPPTGDAFVNGCRLHGAWSMVHGAWIMEMAIVGLSPAKWKERATPTPWKEGVIKAIIKNYKLCPINWHLIVEIYTELTVARKKVGGGVSRHTKLSQAVQAGLPHPHQHPDSHPYVCISTRRWNAGEDQTIPIWWSRCRGQSAAIYDASL